MAKLGNIIEWAFLFSENEVCESVFETVEGTLSHLLIVSVKLDGPLLSLMHFAIDWGFKKVLAEFMSIKCNLWSTVLWHSKVFIDIWKLLHQYIYLSTDFFFIAMTFLVQHVSEWCGLWFLCWLWGMGTTTPCRKRRWHNVRDQDGDPCHVYFCKWWS